MGKVSTCDGCGAQTDNLISMGHVIQKDYCPKCAPKVEKYMKDLDGLHEATVKYFTVRKKKLRDSFKIDLPDS